MPKNLKPALLLTRLFIAYFMLMWALDRFSDAEHAENVANKFYKVGDLSLSAVPPQAIGVFLLVVIFAFVIGLKKRISYGLVMVIHGLGTLFTIKHLVPFSDSFTLIFLAALPTLGAMILLFILRREDTILSLKGKWS
ncbi:hypothetical protein [Litorimonas haliclonae]|uniref:hypothetical protein n=1 Tax=Litorimonas haliclonae TaxID=2081977 RepID=UPI0039EE8CE1